MPVNPLHVFENPDAYWSLLTASQDVELEDQYFDRKEAGQPDGAGKVSSSQIRAVVTALKPKVQNPRYVLALFQKPSNGPGKSALLEKLTPQNTPRPSTRAPQSLPLRRTTPT